MRKTIASTMKMTGTGLHSGDQVGVSVHPYGDGLVLGQSKSRMRASWDNVRHSNLCTLLVSPDDPSFKVSTVEHLMAALAAAGVTDALIEVSGGEIPILDGSALPFWRELKTIGVCGLNRKRDEIIISEVIEVRDGDAFARFTPQDDFTLSMTIDFDNPAIRRQSFSFDPQKEDFGRLLAPARTFCMQKDVKLMRERGLALGGSVENAVVFGETGPLNKEGLRFHDEPARHKLLDALGDLHLAGCSVLGRFEGVRSGHRITNMLLRAVMSRASISDETEESLLAA